MKDPSNDVDMYDFSADGVMIGAEDMCRAIWLRHKDAMNVRKGSVAVPRLVRILGAALDLSNRGGFQAMSLRDLSHASGLSVGGLYAYFDSKTTLLKMILTEVSGVVQEVLSNPPPEVSENPEAQLCWMIDAHLKLTEALLPWFSFAYMEAKNFPPAERRITTASEAVTEEMFAQVLQQGIATGRFRADTPDLLASLVKSMLQDWYVKRAKHRRRGVTLEVYCRTVQDLTLRACLADS